MLADTSPVDIQRRFGGLARLYGDAGAQKIRAAHVVVVGLGGVGSWAAEALARSGVAKLTLIDLDHIAESNINRQIHALATTLGQAKVQAMRERIFHINPDCGVRCIEEFVDAENWPSLAFNDAASTAPISVIDACDQVRAKVAMAAWAMGESSRKKVAPNINFISVGAAGGKRHAHKVDIDDLSLITHDPLLAQLRYRLRKEKGAARQGKLGLTCVFSREAVTQPLVSATAADASTGSGVAEGTGSGIGAGDGSLNCHGYGSVVSVTATFGICAAGWVLGKIAG